MFEKVTTKGEQPDEGVNENVGLFSGNIVMGLLTVYLHPEFVFSEVNEIVNVPAEA